MNTNAIEDIRATEILDSRGMPTVEATVVLHGGSVGTESVPSGASTGKFEAWELRDGDPNRYNGKGVLQACTNVETVIKDALLGIDATTQRAIDQTLIALDGTPNKKKLGANAILAVSLAVARAGATAEHMPLYRFLRTAFALSDSDVQFPRPMLNVVNGGKHADNKLDFQEYHLMPRGTTFAERLRKGAEVVMGIAELLKMRGMSTMVGDEGGFAPRFESNRAPLDLLMSAVERSPYALRDDIEFSLDPASSEFYHEDDHRYMLALDQRSLTSDELISFYDELTAAYPIVSIEDGCADDDWDAWRLLTQRLGKRIQLVGDDLFATNLARFKRGIEEKAGNAILIKPNQIGTLTETMDVIAEAQKHLMPFVISHRSGETNESFIADLSIAVNAPFIKAGSILRGERVAKYNRLLEIEQELS